MSNRILKVLKSAAAIACFVAAGAADASVLQFDLTGAYTASWRMESNPVPPSHYDGLEFTIINVHGIFAGSARKAIDITFYSRYVSGGFMILDWDQAPTSTPIPGEEDSPSVVAFVMSTDGPVLYDGPEKAPVFTVGTFNWFNDIGNNESYTLTITDPSAGAVVPADIGTVPEPASAALVAGGLGMLVAAGRRRRRAR